MLDELKRYIDEKFAALIAIQQQAQCDIIDIDEAAILTRQKVKTLYSKCSKCEIPHYKAGSKLYFRRSELTQWMTANRISTNEEVNGRAALYAATH